MPVLSLLIQIYFFGHGCYQTKTDCTFQRTAHMITCRHHDRSVDEGGIDLLAYEPDFQGIFSFFLFFFSFLYSHVS